MGIDELLNNWEQLQVELPELVVQSIQEIGLELIEKQSEQWLEGKMSDGNDIKPSILEDPYFKTPEAAEAYATWKEGIMPNSKRKRESPSLWINGYTHNNLSVTVDRSGINWDDSAEFFDDIERKYTNKILGLMEEKANDIAFGVFWQALKQKLEQKTGLKFGDDY